MECSKERLVSASCDRMKRNMRQAQVKRWSEPLSRELRFSLLFFPWLHGDTATFRQGERMENPAKSRWKQLGLATHGIHGATRMQAVHEFREVRVLRSLANFVVQDDCIVTHQDAPVAMRDGIKNELGCFSS